MKYRFMTKSSRLQTRRQRVTNILNDCKSQFHSFHPECRSKLASLKVKLENLRKDRDQIRNRFNLHAVIMHDESKSMHKPTFAFISDRKNDIWTVYQRDNYRTVPQNDFEQAFLNSDYGTCEVLIYVKSSMLADSSLAISVPSDFEVGLVDCLRQLQ